MICIDIETDPELVSKMSPGYTFSCGCIVLEVKTPTIINLKLCEKDRKTFNLAVKEKIISKSQETTENHG